MNILRALGGGVVVFLLAGCGEPPQFAEAPAAAVASNLPGAPGDSLSPTLTVEPSASSSPTQTPAPSATALAGPDAGVVPSGMDASMGAAAGCDVTAVTSCGTCDNDCTQLVNIRPEAVSCVAGACQLAADACVAGFADCDGAPGCEASLSAAESCGACGNVCSPPLGLCASANGVSSCAAGCADGELACGGSCVNPATDRFHCGECGIACGNNAACEAGVCACLPGFSGDGQLCCSASQAVVGGACVDLGAAGAACGAELPCAEGLLCAEGVCCFEQCGDNASCGADGECACVDGFVLVDGACIAAQGAGEACPCAAGLHCVDAVCCTEPSCPDNASCGSDGTCSCAPGFQELNGNCAEEQPQGAACSSASPCAAGLFCESSLCCSEACGDDERCNENGEGCRCAEGLTRVGTECLAPQGAGASCAATPCQGGLTCVRDLCCAIDCGDNASCSNNGSRCNCDDGFFLTDDGCAPERDNGSDCSDDEQCASGHCVGGTCCAEDCQRSPENSCGQTGACASSGQCALYSNTTVCVGASCEDGEATLQATCNGRGACNTAQQQSCDGHECSGAVCATRCASDRDCVNDTICVDNDCQEPVARGGSCPGGDECDRDLECVGGTCCTQACPTGASCSANGRACVCDGNNQALCDGRCVNTQTSDTHCGGCNTACSGINSCQGGECEPDCGTQTACGNACVNLQNNEDHCGSCGNECGSNSVCSGGRCGCANGFVSIGGQCVAEVSSGGSCDSGAACASGACGTNGRCCAAPCSPTNASQCGHTGACSTNGACEFWGSNTTCAAADCDDGEATAAAQCNGSGTCVVPRAQSCGAYNCAANACRSSCTNNNHCSGDNFCDDGDCTEPLDDGDACSADAQCDSGNCVDGLCCNIDCNATAQSTCGQTGSCNANGRGCQLWSSATQCRSASCGSGAASAAAFCDGSGSCRAPVVTDCDGHQCNGTTCDTNCNGSDAQCIGDNICDVRDCVEPECTRDSDCGGVGDCESGRCEPTAVLAQAVAGCLTSVPTNGDPAGTHESPFCTVQLAMNYAWSATNIPDVVVMRGDFRNGITVNRDIEIRGEDAAFVGSGTGTAVTVEDDRHLTIEGVDFRDWERGIAGDGSIALRESVMSEIGLHAIDVSRGDAVHTLDDVQMDAGVRLFGSVTAQGVAVSSGSFWMTSNFSGSRCTVEDSSFSAGALSFLFLATCEQVAVEDSTFEHSDGWAIWLNQALFINSNAVSATIQGNRFVGTGNAVQCAAGETITGNNTTGASGRIDPNCQVR